MLLGQLAAAMFGMFCQAGNGDLDHSAIIRMVEGSLSGGGFDGDTRA